MFAALDVTFATFYVFESNVMEALTECLEEPTVICLDRLLLLNAWVRLGTSSKSELEQTDFCFFADNTLSLLEV